MKKITALIFMMAFLLATGFSALAYTPVDEDLLNYNMQESMWIHEATENGIELEWTLEEGDDGSFMWARRIGFRVGMALDGIEVKIDAGKIPKSNTGITVGVVNDTGAWTDNYGLFFIHNLKSETETVLYARYDDINHGIDGPFFNDAPINSDLREEFVLSFSKKDENTWVYKINGQEFEFPNEAVEKTLKHPNDKVYLSFGVWGNQPTSYVVNEINYTGAPEDPVPQTTPAPEDTTKPADTTAGSAPGGDTTGATTKLADNENSKLPIFIGVGAGVVVLVALIILFAVKKKNKEKQND